ncbi:hypothetical protein V8D89_011657 [Ganoderma adspersum]
MQEPSLCFDIFLAIFDVLHDQADAVALASTCKVLNSFGAKRILSFGVKIEDDDALLSFCLFMTADLERRAPHLRKLAISIEFGLFNRDCWGGGSDLLCDYVDPPSDYEEREAESDGDKNRHPETHDMGVQTQSGPEEEEEDMFVAILRAATCLQDLDIGCTEQLLWLGDSDLRRALAGLPALRRLRTATLGPHTLSVVRRMTAPLVEIDLDFRSYNMGAYVDLFDVLNFPASRESLKKVTVWHVALGGPDFVWHTLKDKPCFPRVRTLAVRGIDGGIYLPALVHAFPNVRTLNLTDVVCEGSEMIDVKAERERNKTVCLRGIWRSLTRLSGDLDALYTLGIDRHVSRVDVDKVRLTSQGLTWFRSIVGRTLPSRLLVHMVKQRDVDVYATLDLGGLFPYPVAKRVTNLALDFKAYPGDEAWRLMRRLDERGHDYLQGFTSLERLIVRVGDSDCKLLKDPPNPSGQDLVWFDRVQMQMLGAWANRLLCETIPHLPWVTVDLASRGLGPLGATSISFTKTEDADGEKLATWTWWGQGLGDSDPRSGPQEMQWHRRPAYAEPPVGY